MKSAPPALRFDWRLLSFFGGAALFPAGLALMLAFLLPTEPSDSAVPVLRAVTFKSTPQIEALFNSIDYSWPPRQQVPPIGITRLPWDLAELEVGRKKELFLRALLPLVLAENARLMAERRWLTGVMANGGGSSRKVRDRLRRLARHYGLASVEMDEPESLLPRLSKRIDVVPTGLVLAQAANESGWGTSRFSREVNNLFGEWTYNAMKGVLPQQRRKGDRHLVRSFDNLHSSVRSYMHNLNSGEAYESLRTLRAQMREEGRELDPLLLAKGLVRYSARGESYVAAIRALIRGNGLNSLGPLRLRY